VFVPDFLKGSLTAGSDSRKLLVKQRSFTQNKYPIQPRHRRSVCWLLPGTVMKQHNALALLALLCASQIILIHAKNANSTSVGAKVAQGPEDGYPEQPYEQQTDEGSGPDDEESEEPKCPEPRPADSVKDGKLSCPPLSHAPGSPLEALYCCAATGPFKQLLTEQRAFADVQQSV
jgi:hypothetical protein